MDTSGSLSQGWMQAQGKPPGAVSQLSHGPGVALAACPSHALGRRVGANPAAQILHTPSQLMDQQHFRELLCAFAVLLLKCCSP